MSDQGIPEEQLAPEEQGLPPIPMQPEAAPAEEPPTEQTELELVEAIGAAARASSLSAASAEDVWHFGQGAFYFAQALKLLLAPADPIAAQASADIAVAAAAPRPEPAVAAPPKAAAPRV